MHEQFPQSQQKIYKPPFNWNLGFNVRSSSTFKNKLLICAEKVEWKQQSWKFKNEGEKIINLSTAEHA